MTGGALSINECYQSHSGLPRLLQAHNSFASTPKSLRSGVLCSLQVAGGMRMTGCKYNK